MVSFIPILKTAYCDAAFSFRTDWQYGVTDRKAAARCTKNGGNDVNSRSG